MERLQHVLEQRGFRPTNVRAVWRAGRRCAPLDCASKARGAAGVRRLAGVRSSWRCCSSASRTSRSELTDRRRSPRRCGLAARCAREPAELRCWTSCRRGSPRDRSRVDARQRLSGGVERAGRARTRGRPVLRRRARDGRRSPTLRRAPAERCWRSLRDVVLEHRGHVRARRRAGRSLSGPCTKRSPSQPH